MKIIRRGPPKSDIPNEIIKLLGNKEMRFTELKNMLDISKPSLSKNLEILMNDETIDCVKKGREMYYKIIDKPSKTLERKIPKFSFSYWTNSLLQLFYYPNRNSVTEAFQEIGDMLNSLFLFCLLKSIETGENWFDAFDSKGSAKSTLNILLFALLKGTTITPSMITPYLEKSNLDEFFKEANKNLVKDKKIQANLKEMFEVLKKKYPQEVEALENAYNKV